MLTDEQVAAILDFAADLDRRDTEAHHCSG